MSASAQPSSHGAPDQLEGPCRAPSFREVGAFHEHHPRVHGAGVGRREVGAGEDPRQPRVAPRHVAPPSLQGHDLEVAADPALLVQPAGELPCGEAMAQRDGVEPHEGLEPGPQHRPLHPHAADGVGAVEHHEANAGLRARLHRERHRPHERVDAHADVLQVEEDRVEPREHLRRGLAHLAVQRVDGESRARVHVVARLDHVVLLLAAGTVLRAEERAQAKAGAEQGIHGQREVGGDGGGMQDEAGRGAAQRPRPHRPRRGGRGRCARQVGEVVSWTAT